MSLTPSPERPEGLPDLDPSTWLNRRLPVDHPLLSVPAIPMEPEILRSSPTQEAIDMLIEEANSRSGGPDSFSLVGLTLNQMGVPLNGSIIARNSPEPGEDAEFDFFANPEIVWHSDGVALGREGCYSCEDSEGGRYGAIVPRYKEIEMAGWDRSGATQRRHYEGLSCRAGQHEVGHNRGQRPPDIPDLPPQHRHYVPPGRVGDWRDNWQKWDTFWTPEQWEALKSGVGK